MCKLGDWNTFAKKVVAATASFRFDITCWQMRRTKYSRKKYHFPICTLPRRWLILFCRLQLLLLLHFITATLFYVAYTTIYWQNSLVYLLQPLDKIERNKMYFWGGKFSHCLTLRYQVTRLQQTDITELKPGRCNMDVVKSFHRWFLWALFTDMRQPKTFLFLSKWVYPNKKYSSFSPWTCLLN